MTQKITNVHIRYLATLVLVRSLFEDCMMPKPSDKLETVWDDYVTAMMAWLNAGSPMEVADIATAKYVPAPTFKEKVLAESRWFDARLLVYGDGFQKNSLAGPGFWGTPKDENGVRRFFYTDPARYDLPPPEEPEEEE